MVSGKVRRLSFTHPLILARFSGPSTVQYIVFELADGDVRSVISAADDLDVAWAIRSLHHMAVGLAQLHRTGIAHQDVKP